jgi:hypothetical protein
MIVKMVDDDVPLPAVVMTAVSSLLIPPSDAFRGLGFFVLDVFMVAWCF